MSAFAVCVRDAKGVRDRKRGRKREREFESYNGELDWLNVRSEKWEEAREGRGRFSFVLPRVLLFFIFSLYCSHFIIRVNACFFFFYFLWEGKCVYLGVDSIRESRFFQPIANRQSTSCIAIFGIGSGPWIGRTDEAVFVKKNNSHWIMSFWAKNCIINK